MVWDDMMVCHVMWCDVMSYDIIQTYNTEGMLWYGMIW